MGFIWDGLIRACPPHGHGFFWRVWVGLTLPIGYKRGLFGMGLGRACPQRRSRQRRSWRSRPLRHGCTSRRTRTIRGAQSACVCCGCRSGGGARGGPHFSVSNALLAGKQFMDFRKFLMSGPTLCASYNSAITILSTLQHVYYVYAFQTLTTCQNFASTQAKSVSCGCSLSPAGTTTAATCRCCQEPEFMKSR